MEVKEKNPAENRSLAQRGRLGPLWRGPRGVPFYSR
jgi:hypothetical protein